MSDPITLEQFILQEEHKNPHASGRFTNILNTLALAGKIISREVSKAGLVDILGLTGSTNIQGEEVKKLDAFANTTLKLMLQKSKACMGVASEEDDGITVFPDAKSSYVVLFDPLDGSSNIDVNATLGTIFSIYRLESTPESLRENDFLQKGSEQLAAGYIIYGSGTMLVYTTGDGVNGFTLDPSIGEFLLSHPQICMPSHGNIYSTNEGNTYLWSEGMKQYLSFAKSDEGKKPYKSRYIGTLVADFHRTLLQGGVFIYPSDSKNSEGKLRLLYESAPMALIAEQAGGKASTGTTRLLDIVPLHLHQRVPLVIGSSDNVSEVEGFLIHDK